MPHRSITGALPYVAFAAASGFVLWHVLGADGFAGASLCGGLTAALIARDLYRERKPWTQRRLF